MRVSVSVRVGAVGSGEVPSSFSPPHPALAASLPPQQPRRLQRNPAPRPSHSLPGSLCEGVGGGRQPSHLYRNLSFFPGLGTEPLAILARTGFST